MLHTSINPLFHVTTSNKAQHITAFRKNSVLINSLNLAFLATNPPTDIIKYVTDKGMHNKNKLIIIPNNTVYVIGHSGSYIKAAIIYSNIIDINIMLSLFFVNSFISEYIPLK